MSDSLKTNDLQSKIIYRESNSLRKGRLAAARLWPFARNAIFSMRPIPVKGFGTLGVDKHWRLAYDPDFIETLSVGELGGVILHELLHLLNKHHDRFELTKENSKEDISDWNIATDIAINHMLSEEFDDQRGSKQDKLTLPEDVLHHWNLSYSVPGLEEIEIDDHYSSEENYKIIKSYREERKKDAKKSNHKRTDKGKVPGSGLQAGATTEDIAGTGGVDDNSVEDGRNSSDTEPEQGSNTDTSTADNAPESHNDPVDSGTAEQPSGTEDNSGCLDVSADGELSWTGDAQTRPCSGGLPPDLSSVLSDPNDDGHGIGLSKDEIASVMKDVAYRTQCNEGYTPGSMKLWAKGVSKLTNDPWRRVLNIVKSVTKRSRGSGRRRYNRFNYRSNYSNVILPTRSHNEPRIMICLDTSGSMMDLDFSKARGLVKNLFKNLKQTSKIDIYTGDMALENVVSISRDLAEMELTGGGGTDVGVLIEESLKEIEHKPDIIVAITDGYTPWPSKDIGIPLVIAYTRDTRMHNTPKWATSILLEEI